MEHKLELSISTLGLGSGAGTILKVLETFDRAGLGMHSI